jgi:hypothetical protein
MVMDTLKGGKLNLSPNVWLNCLHCDSYFQVKDLRPDPWFGRQGCPFCGAAGYGVDIFRRNPNLGKVWERAARKAKHQQATMRH